MNTVKHLPSLCIALFCLMLPCVQPAIAESSNVDISISAHHVAFSFCLEGEQYAYVKVTTENDTGSQVLYSENGAFSGSMALPNCYEPMRLVIDVMKINGKNMYRYTGKTLEVAEPDASVPQDTSIPGSSRADDVVITMVEGGFDYSFAVPGRDEVYLTYKSQMEKHIAHLYAGENYAYSGHIDMPLTFAEDTVTVTISTVNSSHELYKGTYQAYYSPLPAVSQSAEGRLKGVIVCVDPGHQNQTEIETVRQAPNWQKTVTTQPGMARGRVTNRRESIVTLEIGLMLRNALLREGATVVMTRESQDDFVGMLERADIPNNAGAHFTLRLHCNKRSDETVQGIAIYCPWQSSYAMEVADEATYRAMGETLLAAMQKATGQSKGKCTLSNAYVGNNWSMMPSFLVEMGYMSNHKEDLLMSCSPVYQQKLVEGMVQGIYDLSVRRGLIQE